MAAKRPVILIAAAVIFPLSILGCGPQQKPEEIKAALIAFDPAFKVVLDKKAQIDSQTETMNGEFRAKQGEINSKIMELEEELKTARKELYAKVNELNSQLDPERQKINLKVEVGWSGRTDLNCRPPGPKPGALASCATPRLYHITKKALQIFL